MTNAALRGKPDAGNPHVRFDEGEVALAATPRRGSLLYRKQLARIKAAVFSARLAPLTLLALLAFGASGVRAETPLNPTVSGSSFTINNENATQFANSSQDVSSPTLKIPASTGLKKVGVSEISIGQRLDNSSTYRKYPNKIQITDGTKTYTSAAKSEDSNVKFTCANNTSQQSVKLTYSFAKTGCLLTVGETYTIAFLNSNGTEMTGSQALNVGVAEETDSLFGSTVEHVASGNHWRPIQEIKGDIIWLFRHKCGSFHATS